MREWRQRGVKPQKRRWAGDLGNQDFYFCVSATCSGLVNKPHHHLLSLVIWWLRLVPCSSFFSSHREKTQGLSCHQEAGAPLPTDPCLCFSNLLIPLSRHYCVLSPQCAQPSRAPLTLCQILPIATPGSFFTCSCCYSSRNSTCPAGLPSNTGHQGAPSWASVPASARLLGEGWSQVLCSLALPVGFP